MKQVKFILPFLMFFTLFLTNSNAQTTRKYFNTKKEDKASPLWYGVGLRNLTFWGNTLAVGAAPMIGYKIIPRISVGVLAKLDYSFTRNAPASQRSNFDYGIGPFVRAKIFRGVYAHGEYEYTSYQTTSAAQSRIWEPHAYVGLGYNVGGNKTWSSDITALVNLLDKQTSTATTFGRFFDYRFAITFNF